MGSKLQHQDFPGWGGEHCIWDEKEAHLLCGWLKDDGVNSVMNELESSGRI